MATSNGEPHAEGNAGDPEPSRMDHDHEGPVTQHEARAAELDGQLVHATDGATMASKAAQEVGAGGDEPWRTECRRARASENGS